MDFSSYYFLWSKDYGICDLYKNDSQIYHYMQLYKIIISFDNIYIYIYIYIYPLIQIV